MYTLYNDLTNFSKKLFKSGLLQFLTMWILWDRKCEYGFFHITHAKNSSNHSSSTRDLTRFFGICDVEKAKLTFPPHSILSMFVNMFAFEKISGVYSIGCQIAWCETSTSDRFLKQWRRNTIAWSVPPLDDKEVPACHWMVSEEFHVCVDIRTTCRL